MAEQASGSILSPEGLPQAAVSSWDFPLLDWLSDTKIKPSVINLLDGLLAYAASCNDKCYNWAHKQCLVNCDDAIKWPDLHLLSLPWTNKHA